MLDAAREALAFAQGRTRTDLDKDRMLVLALIKDIEIVGEAANQISEATRELIREVPWDDIIGIRHRLVHAYFDIDLDPREAGNEVDARMTRGDKPRRRPASRPRSR